MSKISMPQIHEVALKDLEIDLSYSGRAQKEIDANAKKLAPVMAAHGSWDATQPGQYFVRDKKKYLLRGFTRLAACLINGTKIGNFAEVPDEPDVHRFDCIVSNVGKPISPFQMGKKFSEALKTIDPAKVKVGELIPTTLTLDEIAANTGISKQWVKDCLAIYESPEAIGVLIESGQVASGVFVRAKQLSEGDESKLKGMIVAALDCAKEQGKTTATMTHLDAIKEKFVAKKPETKEETPALTEAPKRQRAETPAAPEPSSLGDLESSGSENQKTPGVGLINLSVKGIVKIDRVIYDEIVSQWVLLHAVEVTPEQYDGLIDLLCVGGIIAADKPKDEPASKPATSKSSKKK